LNLCIDRAKIRHLSGGHEVKEEVIKEMYKHTFSLFHQNKALFGNVLLVDVTDTSIIPVSKNTSQIPKWIIDNQMTDYLR
jgi:predicted ABC-type ATPase